MAFDLDKMQARFKALGIDLTREECAERATKAEAAFRAEVDALMTAGLDEMVASGRAWSDALKRLLAEAATDALQRP